MSGLQLVRHQKEQDNLIEARVKKAGDTMTGNLTMSNNAKVVGNLQGNSDTSTRLQTTRNFSINGVSKGFNGTGNVAWTLNEIGVAPVNHNQASNTITTMAGYSKGTSSAAIGTGDTLNQAIGKLEVGLGTKASTSHTHNYAGSSSTGGAATTSLACTGNSATATKLQTARGITIGGTKLNFDGSADISYTLPQIGAVQFEYSSDPVVNGGRVPTIFADGSEWFMTRSGGIVPHRNEGGYLGVPTRKFYDVNTVHINALHVGGHANNQRWELIPVVNNQGVMEIGRYVDFHNVKSSVSDYTFRLDNHSQNECVYYGTLSQYSDRRLKENIEYIDDIQMLSNSKIRKEEYKFKDFIKEIRFATFKYKGSKENTFGFIAQDLENFEVADYMLKDITSEAVNDIDADENGQATYKSFDTMAYASVIAKALQEEIKFRDKQIESLEEKIKLLEKKIDALAS